MVIPSFLLHLTAALSNGTVGNASCAPARCGDLNITYPFSLGGVQPLEGGFPVFQLACSAGRAYITRSFRERLYRVLSISSDTNSLVIAVETTFAGSYSCPVPDFNISSSLASFPLRISSTNKNLNFVYNCDVPSTVKLPQRCGNRTMGAFFSEDTEARKKVPSNCSSVIVPVRSIQDEKQPARNYVKMISDGFLLKWPTVGDCDACRQIVGECRFVELTFQCVCLEGLPCSQGEEQV